MPYQKGILQILISVLIIAVLFLAVMAYFNRSSFLPKSELENSGINIDTNQSPKGLIEDVRENINDIENKKNQEIQDYLDK